ncbi:MAG: tetratricopeptide repeat protein [Chitinophagaceae bacterium]|nr:tetratricopeptide repeat protein [Chitinophagaceae bacterium]
MKTYLSAIWLIIISFLPQAGFAQDATTFYNEGVKLKNEKKVAEAIEKFKKAVALRPDYTEALYEWGWCQNDLKDYEGAIINLRKARTAWTAVPKVYFELGYAFEKSNRTDSAILTYNRCLELKPDYSLVYKQLGYIAYNKNDNITALEHFKKYESFTKTEIKDYLYWYRKGFVYNALKDYTNAITALKQSESFKSDYANTYLELGFACTRLKQDEEAISYFKKAIEIDPKSHIPYNGIGEVYRDNKKDMNEAMNWYQKSLTINPAERKANFGMGYCLNSTGKYNEAITYLKKAIESERDYVAAFVELGYSYYMTGKYTEAIDHCNKAISLSPKNENARYYAGLVYIKQNNKTMAQKMADELKMLSSKLAATLQAKVDAL